MGLMGAHSIAADAEVSKIGVTAQIWNSAIKRMLVKNNLAVYWFFIPIPSRADLS
jgi:hypothetical protein